MFSIWGLHGAPGSERRWGTERLLQEVHESWRVGRDGGQQVHCTNVGRQGQSGERLFLEILRPSVHPSTHPSIHQTYDSPPLLFCTFASLSLPLSLSLLSIVFSSAGPLKKMKEKNKNQTAFFMKRKQRLVRPGGLGLLRADRARLQQCFDSSGSARVSLIQKSIKIFLFFAGRGPEK